MQNDSKTENCSRERTPIFLKRREPVQRSFTVGYHESDRGDASPATGSAPWQNANERYSGSITNRRNAASDFIGQRNCREWRLEKARLFSATIDALHVASVRMEDQFFKFQCFGDFPKKGTDSLALRNDAEIVKKAIRGQSAANEIHTDDFEPIFFEKARKRWYCEKVNVTIAIAHAPLATAEQLEH